MMATLYALLYIGVVIGVVIGLAYLVDRQEERGDWPSSDYDPHDWQ